MLVHGILITVLKIDIKYMDDLYEVVWGFVVFF